MCVGICMCVCLCVGLCVYNSVTVFHVCQTLCMCTCICMHVPVTCVWLCVHTCMYMGLCMCVWRRGGQLAHAGFPPTSIHTHTLAVSSLNIPHVNSARGQQWETSPVNCCRQFPPAM